MERASGKGAEGGSCYITTSTLSAKDGADYVACYFESTNVIRINNYQDTFSGPNIGFRTQVKVTGGTDDLGCIGAVSSYGSSGYLIDGTSDV